MKAKTGSIVSLAWLGRLCYGLGMHRRSGSVATFGGVDEALSAPCPLCNKEVSFCRCAHWHGYALAIGISAPGSVSIIGGPSEAGMNRQMEAKIAILADAHTVAEQRLSGRGGRTALHTAQA